MRHKLERILQKFWASFGGFANAAEDIVDDSTSAFGDLTQDVNEVGKVTKDENQTL